jgi:hypothetical protein
MWSVTCLPRKDTFTRPLAGVRSRVPATLPITLTGSMHALLAACVGLVRVTSE